MADKGSNCQKVWSNTKSTSSKSHSRAAKLSAVYAYSACLLASPKVGLVRTVLSAYLGFCGPAYSPTRLSFCGPSANCIALLRPTSDHSPCLTLWRASVSERTPLITQLGGRNDLVTKKVPLAHHGGPGPRNARIALGANATAQRYPSEMPIEYTSDSKILLR